MTHQAMIPHSPILESFSRRYSDDTKANRSGSFVRDSPSAYSFDLSKEEEEDDEQPMPSISSASLSRIDPLRLKYFQKLQIPPPVVTQVIAIPQRPKKIPDTMRARSLPVDVPFKRKGDDFFYQDPQDEPVSKSHYDEYSLCFEMDGE
eukprot:TRINITY_DN1208_c0_g1_i2.p1 TRINITY_DN1208_c0_g1~~TRINITY_DN1208_c0_g1_i2.p1  ORF type:complete len:148 (-),score=14.18 TRINITY_DN1208_c0_g1_i2:113-556(-)